MGSIMKPVKLEDIPVKRNISGIVIKTLTEFCDSGMEACEIDWKGAGYESEIRASNSFRQVVSRKKFPVKTAVRDGRFYLIKKVE